MTEQETISQPEAPITSDETLSETNETVAEPSKGEVVSEESGLSSFLSDELKEIKALHNFKDVNGLAKSYVHLNGLLGKKFEDLSTDELKSFYGKLGRPENSDSYKFPDLPKTELMGWYREKAFDLGLNQDQAKNLMESYTEIEQMRLKEMETEYQTTTNEWVDEIKADFGGAFDKRLEIAKKAVQTFGGQELKDYLNQSGLGNHPAMVKAFAKIGRELLEDRLTETDASNQFGLTPQEALHKVTTLKRDTDFMKSYRSASDPGHSAAVDEIQDLYKIAYPKE